MKYQSIPIDVERIRYEMAARGWTMSMAAEEMGYERCQLALILKKGRCRASTLEVIALALELPVTELMAEDTAYLNCVLDEGAVMPTRAHEYDAGLDLYAMEEGDIPPCGSAVFDTGTHVAVPKGFVGLLTSKSGLMQQQVTSRGTIDYGYTGSIKAVLFNDSHKYFHIEKGQKITQLVLMPIIVPKPRLVDSLELTERGDGGFGSSGKF